MSDRRPENLYAKDREDWRGDTYRSASPADLLAVVRRGVESGTIKGEVVESETFAGVAGPDWTFHTSKPGTYIIIGPVPDREAV